MTSKAVNRPTDTKFKDQDVSNKLQAYGIYSAFAKGKAPSNQQIDVALNSALESTALSKPSDRLSADGKQLVADLRDVIENAKVLLLTKNDGNLLQDFIWQTQQATVGDAKMPGAPVNKDQAKQHGNEALDGLRTLGTLLISNGQFRKLLNDAVILLRSIAGDAATKTAGRVNPSDDKLRQIDDPAEDNTWHDVPDPKKMREQFKQGYNERKPFGKKDVKQAADSGAATTEDQADAPADTAATNGVKTAAGDLKSTASANVPEETKEKGRNYAGRTKSYLSTKMPKERREQTIWRLKKMVVEVQGHQDYQRAIETLLRLAEDYGRHSRSMATEGQGTLKGAHKDNSLVSAETDLKTLIERFANSTSMDDLFDAIKQIYKDADKDPELKEWFRNLDTYVRKCLNEQGFILQPAATNEWNELYNRGNYLLREKYKSHTDRVLDELKFLKTQFDEDPLNKAFGESVQKLFLDLGNDEAGNPKFKPHLVKDLTEVIIPSFLVNLHYVPIPRIEYQDPMMDVVVENLIIESDNLTPNSLEFGSDNYWRWGRQKISNKHKNKVMLSVSGVQMDLRDVNYYINKKQGFPSISDQGVCDIFLGGDGLSFKIEMETADKGDKAHFFQVKKVKVDVKNFNIKLKKSKHKILFAVAKPILLKVIRPALQKVTEKAIRDNAAELDAFMHAIYQDAEKAKVDAKRNPDPENVKNVYQRYWHVVNQRMLQMKEKKKRAAEKTPNTEESGKKLNMAMITPDSIFPDVKLQGGISEKATEYRDLADKGDKWESPVFSVGKAKPSQGIGKPAEIRRKGGRGAMGTGSGMTNGPQGGTTRGFENQVDQAFAEKQSAGQMGNAAMPTTA